MSTTCSKATFEAQINKLSKVKLSLKIAFSSN